MAEERISYSEDCLSGEKEGRISLIKVRYTPKHWGLLGWQLPPSTEHSLKAALSSWISVYSHLAPSDGHSSQLSSARQKGTDLDAGRRWLKAIVEHSLWLEGRLGWPPDLIQSVSSHLSSS